MKTARQRKTKNEWEMLILSLEDEQRIYRIRSDVPEGVNKTDFANCVILEWRFAEGLPDKKTDAQQQAFESLMDPLDDPTNNSLLMHVYTGSGIKEWCYYARDYDRFMKEFNKLLTRKPRFPIQILHDHDAIWKYWSAIKHYATNGKALKAA